ncbi:hypothetical protein [Acinetobacter calcoaceticus]|uniref:hypothetical protein n=1 Tax=Acinetobacter calcoaceticus TaxID=471 RepID=UPI002863E340|nr:hypothetical protein [Acinetobacter calcoaceticus]MDR6797841.1 hypothetical protein [Acinetobacter calcoaceticus]
MNVEKFYKIFSYVVISSITAFFFVLIESFFDSVIAVYELENSSIRSFITLLVAFLTNFWFQDLFKERIREACLVNFLTYKLNFEIFRFK